MDSQTVIDSPIGPLFLVASERGLRRLEFARDASPGGIGHGRPERPRDAAEFMLSEAVRQLDEYFAGARRDFDLPLDVEGTDFQRRIWDQIAAIRYGEVASYAEIARRAGAPNAYRAAGTACGANRVAIVIPCHRVVGTDKGLHGFGGGLDTKRWLLGHEAAQAAAAAPERSPQLALV